MSVTIPFEAALPSTSGPAYGRAIPGPAYGLGSAEVGACADTWATSADTWTTKNASARPRARTRTDTWTKAIQLPASARAAGAARDHVRRCVRAWNAVSAATRAASEIMHITGDTPSEPPISDDCAETAILLTSEMVTNALVHGESPMTVAVSWHGEQLRVEVHDRSRHLPTPWPVRMAPDDEAGRGLLLVDTLATDWGFYRTPGGKAVYFTLDCPAPDRTAR